MVEGGGAVRPGAAVSPASQLSGVPGTRRVLSHCSAALTRYVRCTAVVTSWDQKSAARGPPLAGFVHSVSRPGTIIGDIMTRTIGLSWPARMPVARRAG